MKAIEAIKMAGWVVLAVGVLCIGGLVRESLSKATRGTWIHRVCSLVSGM